MNKIVMLRGGPADGKIITIHEGNAIVIVNPDTLEEIKYVPTTEPELDGYIPIWRPDA